MPRFQPSIWNVHDITVNNADRTNNFTEAWNRGFETLLSENHPSIETCIELLQEADAAQAASILLKHANGRRRRWQQMQRRLHGLCVEYDNEQRPLEYKLLSLTYKVLTTSQPSYLNNLISVQPHRSTCSSVVTLSRPPTISSLKITDRSFRYAAPRLWNQLTDSFRQPRQSCLDSLPHSLVSSSLLLSPLSSSITPLFHSRLKTYLFNKSFPP